MPKTFAPSDCVPAGPSPALPADLALVVRHPDGSAQEAFLQHGLTIGRHLANALVVDHHDVGPTHARVERQRDGSLRLKCRGRGNYLVLSDGSAFKELNLCPGTTFGVGPAVVTCAARRPYAVVVPAQPVEGARPAQCLRCHNPLDRAASARFCPRCGARIEAPAGPGGEGVPCVEVEPAAPPVPAPTAAARPANAREAVKEPSAAMQVGATLRRLLLTPVWPRPKPPAKPPAQPPPLEGDPHSLILLGYGNALFKLGWRYETRAPRNLPEAQRCYRKAAKLGNESAQVRLPEAGSAQNPSRPSL